MLVEQITKSGCEIELNDSEIMIIDAYCGFTGQEPQEVLAEIFATAIIDLGAKTLLEIENKAPV